MTNEIYNDHGIQVVRYSRGVGNGYGYEITLSNDDRELQRRLSEEEFKSFLLACFRFFE